MAIATFDGIPFPKVFEVEIEDDVIGDFGRTAGGKERGDVIAVKRMVTLRTRGSVTNEQRNQLVQYLRGILYRYGEFVIEGEEPFMARLTLQQRKNYVLPNHWELTVTVTEQ